MRLLAKSMRLVDVTMTALLVSIMFIGATELRSQDVPLYEVGSDSTRKLFDERISGMSKRADSLRDEWRVQWKRSDSARIASMLLRMQSDSLRRDVTKLVSGRTSDSLNAADSVREQSLRTLYDTALRNINRKNASALTASDSITAAVMIVEPDTGVASFYANAFHGKKTSSGETYNMNDKTCAHRWLPFGTLLCIRNLSNGKVSVVRVNDRGPFKHGRIVDISKGAALEIDMIRAGTARVEVRVVVKIPEADSIAPASNQPDTVVPDP